MSFTYLATPYSHKDPAVKQWRFVQVNRMAAKLMGEGVHVYSPISHSHPIAMEGDLPGTWEFWEEYDRKILSICNRFIVLRLPGWDTSTGVSAEIKIARELGIEVEYVDPLPARPDFSSLRGYGYNGPTADHDLDAMYPEPE